MTSALAADAGGESLPRTEPARRGSEEEARGSSFPDSGVAYSAYLGGRALAVERVIADSRAVALVFGTAYLVFAARWSGWISWLAILLVVIGWIYAPVCLFLARTRSVVPSSAVLWSSVLDGITVLAWIVATGGADSDFYVVIYPFILAIAFRHGYRGALVGTWALAAGYPAVVALTGGFVGRPDVMIRVFYLLVIASLAAVISREALTQSRERIRLLLQRHDVERAKAGLFRTIFEASPDPVAVNRISDGRFVEVNDEFVRCTGYERSEVVATTSCDLGLWADPNEAERFQTEVRERGVVRDIEVGLRRKDGTIRQVSVSSVVAHDRGEAFTFLQDVTERRAAERSLQAMSARIVKLQDEERRRIARELHDSTSQNLAAVSMYFSLVERAVDRLDPRTRNAVVESISLLEDCVREVRTISYLLHPPALEDVDLPSALRSYAQGFDRRSGIRVDLQIEAGLAGLGREAELALFRVLQECLTNIHRHSGSPVARIRLDRKNDHVLLEVADSGRGMPVPMPGDDSQGSGLGLASMRERVAELGGRLEMESGKRGTTIRAIVPVTGMAS